MRIDNFFPVMRYVLVLQMAFIYHCGFGASVRIEATAKTEVTALDGKVLPTKVRRYKFTVDLAGDGRWIAQLQPLDAYGVIEYLSFDGVDSYYVRYPGPISHPTWDRVNRIATADISTGPLCLSAMYVEDPIRYSIWLTYGSAVWFKSPMETVNPWMSPRVYLLGHGYTNRVMLNSGSPGLPMSGQFYRDNSNDKTFESDNDSILLDRTLTASRLEDRKREWRSRNQITNGTIVVSFSCEDWKKSDGIEFPGKSVIRVLDQGSHWWIHSIEVKEFHSGTETVFQPPIETNIVTIDTRGRSRTATHALDNVRYFTSATNRWTPSSSTNLAAHYRAALASSPKRTLSLWARYRQYIIGVAALVMLVVPVVYSYRFRSSRD